MEAINFRSNNINWGFDGAENTNYTYGLIEHLIEGLSRKNRLQKIYDNRKIKSMSLVWA